MKKALVLLSGGLDSVLAGWLIKNQGIELEGLVFSSPFFEPNNGIVAAKQLQIPCRVADISKELVKKVANPKYGWGSGINPCIDCHLIMLQQAKKILEKENYDFVVTGEVLGQRPFSQNAKAMSLLARKSGLKKRLLRPLSAQLLDPTLPEKKGWVNRKKLLDIRGRGRKIQLQLAKKNDLAFSPPAGGCLLCEKEFAKKARKLLERKSTLKIKDALLLKIGRHFWKDDTQIILGRNQGENHQLEKLAGPKDRLFQPANFGGPNGLVCHFEKDKNLEKETKKLILKYTQKRKLGQPLKPIVFFGSSEESVFVLEEILKEKIPLGAVITQPDRPAGRGQKLKPTPVGEYCRKNNHPVFKWSKLDNVSLQKTKKKINFQPHLGVCAVYGNLIPSSWLEWSNLIINIHPSLLPKFRGGVPVVQTLLKNKKTTGVTLIKMGKELDNGPIIKQTKTKIKPSETAGKLTKRLFKQGTQDLTGILKKVYFSQSPYLLELTPQDDTKASFAYAKDLSKENAEINWQATKQKIHNQIRAFNPRPGAYTWVKIGKEKKRLKIWRSKLKKGKLTLETVQLEGKNKVSWKQLCSAYPAIKEQLPKQLLS